MQFVLFAYERESTNNAPVLAVTQWFLTFHEPGTCQPHDSFFQESSALCRRHKLISKENFLYASHWSQGELGVTSYAARGTFYWSFPISAIPSTCILSNDYLPSAVARHVKVH